MRKTLFFLFVVFFLPGLTGCGGKKRPLNPVAPEDENNQASVNRNGTTVPAGSAILWTDIKLIFKNRCSNCHDHKYPRLDEAGHIDPNAEKLPAFDLQDYLIVKKYVDNGKLLKVIWTLRNDPKKRMPWKLGLPKNVKDMTDEERKKIKDWIEAGAPKEATTNQAPVPVSRSGTGTGPVIRWSDIKPIFEKHCVICHQSPQPRLDGSMLNKFDLKNYSVAKKYVDNGELFKRVWTLRDDPQKGMPFGGGMEIEKRQKIKDWIEAGAPK